MKPAGAGFSFIATLLAALVWAVPVAPAFGQSSSEDLELCPGGICPVPDGLFGSQERVEVTSDGSDEKEAVQFLPDLSSFEIVRVQAGDPGAKAFEAFIRGESVGENAFSTALSKGGAPLLVLALVFAGVLLNLTPCTLPLFPVNLAILGIGAGRSSRRRGAITGLAFGTGMALCYGALGLVAARTGRTFGAIHGSAAFSAVVAAVFAMLSLASLGVFNIDFSRFRNVLPRRSGSARRRDAPSEGGLAGAAARLFGAMAAGAGSAALAGACVAPALVSALVLAADLSARGNSIGALVPFALGVGMGLPWPFAGAGLAALPKPGAWMERIKTVFAVVFAAAAACYLVRAWSIAAPESASRFFAKKTPVAGSLDFLTDERAAAIVAIASEKPLLVDFSADWCSACRAMDKGTLADPGVRAAIAECHGQALLRLDCTDTSDPVVDGYFKRFNVPGLPFFAIMRPLRK